MAGELKLRRGTTQQHEVFTGAQAEVTVDTDTNSLVVHDGVTPGGFRVPNEEAFSAGDVTVSDFSGGKYEAIASGNTLTIIGTPVDELTGEPKFHVGRRVFCEGEARTITDVAESNGNTVVTVDGAALSAGSVGVYLGPPWEASADPLQAALARDGAAMVGYDGRTIKGALDSLTKRRNPIIPPSLPAITGGPKLVMTVGGNVYVVTKKANGRQGYVAMRIGNTVASADAQNIGGASNRRLEEVMHVGQVYVAKTNVLSKTPGVTLSSAGNAYNRIVWGHQGISYDAEYYATSLDTSPEVNLTNLALYEIPAGGNVTYAVTGPFATVRLGLSAGSSTDCRIEVSADNTAWSTAAALDNSLTTSGSGKNDVRVESPAAHGTWYVRVRNNAESRPVYVAGLNIGQLQDIDVEQDIDNALFQSRPRIDGTPNGWLLGGGANEFAAKTLAGVWHGTYHGGHSNFLERLRTDASNYNLDSGTPPSLDLTASVQLFSTSTLNIDSSQYRYTAIVQFGDGVAITNYSIELASGEPVMFEDVYTHMCTTNPTFEFVHAPVYLFNIGNGNVSIGQTGYIQQHRTTDEITLNTYFSQVDLTENSWNGAYLRFVDNYHKQYYGPAFGSDGFSAIDGTYTTAKEFF